MNDMVSEIQTARVFGVVHCGFSSQRAPALAELAAEFGLDPDVACYQAIDAESARWLATMILHQDMAYNFEILPRERAAELAGRFLWLFGSEEDGARFYTNGTFHEVPGPKLTRSGVEWNSVTGATFDTGILILGPDRSGCLWMEDED